MPGLTQVTRGIQEETKGGFYDARTILAVGIETPPDRARRPDTHRSGKGPADDISREHAQGRTGRSYVRRRGGIPHRSDERDQGHSEPGGSASGLLAHGASLPAC